MTDSSEIQTSSRVRSKMSRDRKLLLAMMAAAVFGEAMMFTALYDNLSQPSINNMMQQTIACQETLNRIYTRYSNGHTGKGI